MSEVIRTTVRLALTNREGRQVNARGIKGTELERVLNWAGSASLSISVPPSRSIVGVFAETISALTIARIKYVLAETLAFGLYAPVRATRCIVVLIRAADRTLTEGALRNAGFRQTGEDQTQLNFQCDETGTELHALLTADDPVNAALDNAEDHAAYGLTVPVIRPEYLLWRYCLSDLAQSFADAVELVKAGQVDVGKLRQMLDRAGDQATLSQLGGVLKTAAAERHSSYSRSVAARRRPGEEL